MSDSTWKSPLLLIPIVLVGLVVLMVPSLYRQWCLERTVIIAAASMGAP